MLTAAVNTNGVVKILALLSDHIAGLPIAVFHALMYHRPMHTQIAMKVTVFAWIAQRLWTSMETTVTILSALVVSLSMGPLLLRFKTVDLGMVMVSSSLRTLTRMAKHLPS